ncbi:IPT/TIG domain-containing protein [Parabacteroides sp. OttesenSCG-928-G07]|nr:IPT/TIG domain-containing protein [Parabacteroides sp. OttesenSCG-928-G21]MDL2278446.1 IPT/TIG domain-containing protein [Parabacteroides sp. OttesenSCG-928-G07]
MKKILLLTITCLALASGMSLHAQVLKVGGKEFATFEYFEYGTGWEARRDTSSSSFTLTLDEKYTGEVIHVNSTAKVTIVYTGNVSINSNGAVPIHSPYSLTIKGNSDSKLSLTNTGTESQCYALHTGGILTIEGGTLELSSSGSSVLYNGLFNSKSTALYAAAGLEVAEGVQINATVTGENATGILLAGADQTSDIAGNITASSTGIGSAIWIDNGHKLIVKSGSLVLSNTAASNPIKGNGTFEMEGGTVQYNNGPVPELTAISEDSGELGDSILLTGYNLSDTAKVWVGGKEAIVAVESTDNNVIFIIPAGKAGETASILIEAAGGRTFMKDAFTYTETSYRVTLSIPTEAQLEGNLFVDVAANTAISTLLPVATQEECVFRGWSTDQIDFVPWGEDAEVTSDTLLHGKFIMAAQLVLAADAEKASLSAPITIVFPTNPGDCITDIFNQTSITPDPGNVSCTFEERPVTKAGPTEWVATIYHNDFAPNTEYTITIPKGAFSIYPEAITMTFFSVLPITYAINFDVAEGIRINPDNEDYTIEEGHDYTFYMYMEEGLANKKPYVTVNDQSVAIRETQDGTGWVYRIPEVYADQHIAILLQDLVSNLNPEEAGITIYSSAGALIAETAQPTLITIYNITGQAVVQQRVDSRATFALPKGIYIVRTDKGTTKAIVR